MVKEAQRVVRRAIRDANCSPEVFAARYSSLIWSASGRTVRRWRDGESQPHPSVVNTLADYDFAEETRLRAAQHSGRV